jgi:hypothetical protein
LDAIQIGFAQLPGLVKYAPVNPVLAAQVCPYTKKALADLLLFFAKPAWLRLQTSASNWNDERVSPWSERLLWRNYYE